MTCDEDVNCGAVECGRQLCSWWRTGICITDAEQTWNRRNSSSALRTCIKGNFYIYFLSGWSI